MFNPAITVLGAGRASRAGLAAILHDGIPCARIGFLMNQFPERKLRLDRSKLPLTTIAGLFTETRGLRLQAPSVGE